MRTLLISLALILLAGCSAKRPDNAWQHSLATSAKQAELYFLEGEQPLAESTYRRAKTYAKQSADLSSLERLVLQQCALNHAVLVSDSCEAYREIASLGDNVTHASYYALLTGSLRTKNIDDLPRRYRNFARALSGRDSQKIAQAISSMEPLTSRMVAASLAQNHLNDVMVESIIKSASYFGYKRAVIAWMKYLAGTTEDAGKRALLKHKIRILTKSR